jgi:3-hydroxybutyrate dehydrogenase
VLNQSISAEGEGTIRSLTLRTGFVKTPPALNQIPAQAEQRAITEEQIPARESGFNLTCHFNF